MRGDYVEDGGAYTVDISSYSPNDYGLYNIRETWSSDEHSVR